MANDALGCHRVQALSESHRALVVAHLVEAFDDRCDYPF